MHQNGVNRGDAEELKGASRGRAEEMSVLGKGGGRGRLGEIIGDAGDFQLGGTSDDRRLPFPLTK